MDYMVAAKNNELRIANGQMEQLRVRLQEYESKNLDAYEAVQEENAKVRLCVDLFIA